jgi:hypothetical protein
MAKPVQVRRCPATVTGETPLPEARTTASVTLHRNLAEWVREQVNGLPTSAAQASINDHLSPLIPTLIASRMLNHRAPVGP